MRSFRLPRGASATTAVAVAGCCVCVLWAVQADHSRLLDPLTIVLALSALTANVASTRWSGPVLASASFVPSMLAVAYLGPAPAFGIAALGELGAWMFARIPPLLLAINVVGAGLPNLVAASAFAALVPGTPYTAAAAATPQFYLLLALMAWVALVVNFMTVAPLLHLLGRKTIPDPASYARAMLPALGINVGLTLATAAIYHEVGIAGALLVLLIVLAYSYMARLVVTARERTRQYASLSWGVLAGLLRTLDLRDPRAARHAAAVAAFARDIAEASGMSPRECELAHTAGLLHDIGRFGLSDRVMERGRPLTEEDWQNIRRHPVLGADMLRDIGVYGPVAEIVHAHHERLDGRGYPDGLTADEIPEIAKIVAVAEVYDTLTADDTYRTPMSSFEALNELRRVSGTQLDGGYVEVLSELLAGRGLEYRHADRADFDRELDIERRIKEAAAL